MHEKWDAHACKVITWNIMHAKYFDMGMKTTKTKKNLNIYLTIQNPYVWNCK